MLNQRAISNNDTSRVSSDVTHHAFQAVRDFNHFRNLLVLIHQVAEFRALLDSLSHLNAEFVGNHLGDFVNPCRRKTESARNVSNRRFRLQGSKRADLADTVLAVSFLCVVDHFLPTVTAEIDIDIRRLRSVRIEEPLEQQVVLQRADITQAKKESDNRSGRRTSRTTRNVFLHREPNKVPHDQEVTRIAHLLDDA